MVAADAPARTTRAIGVRFRRAGRLYYYDPDDAEVAVGDYVIVESRNNALNGETVVALVNGDSATLKRFYREGAQIRLQPANEAMAPIMVDETDLHIQGVVVGVLRKY